MTNRFDRGISHSPDNFPRTPDLKLGWMPEWCHLHATKMMVVDENQEGYDPNKLKIKGSAAEVSIAELREVPGFWGVEWKVIHSQIEFAQGRIAMTKDDLEMAFGISDEIGKYGTAILERYGGTTASQGKYVRWRNFLNIPGPGTGHDGDPNVSIELDDQIKSAVRKLIHR